MGYIPGTMQRLPCRALLLFEQLPDRQLLELVSFILLLDNFFAHPTHSHTSISMITTQVTTRAAKAVGQRGRRRVGGRRGLASHASRRGSRVPIPRQVGGGEGGESCETQCGHEAGCINAIRPSPSYFARNQEGDPQRNCRPCQDVVRGANKGRLDANSARSLSPTPS